MDRSLDSFLLQHGSEVLSLHLRQVWRFFDDAVSNDPGEPDTDRFDRLALSGRLDLLGYQVYDLIGVHPAQNISPISVRGKDGDLARHAVLFDRPGVYVI